MIVVFSFVKWLPCDFINLRLVSKYEEVLPLFLQVQYFVTIKQLGNDGSQTVLSCSNAVLGPKYRKGHEGMYILCLLARKSPNFHSKHEE